MESRRERLEAVINGSNRVENTGWGWLTGIRTSRDAKHPLFLFGTTWRQSEAYKF
jgi:hypothetical protein